MNHSDYKNVLREFAKARDWDKFHSPKNLSMGLASEAGELLDIFRWLSEEESYRLKVDFPKEYSEARLELADIFLHLLRICDKLDVNLESAVEDKLTLNAKKYPVDLSKGNAIKYNRRRDADENKSQIFPKTKC